MSRNKKETTPLNLCLSTINKRGALFSIKHTRKPTKTSSFIIEKDYIKFGIQYYPVFFIIQHLSYFFFLNSNMLLNFKVAVKVFAASEAKKIRKKMMLYRSNFHLSGIIKYYNLLLLVYVVAAVAGVLHVVKFCICCY